MYIFLVNLKLTSSEIARAVGELFDFASSEVLVVDDITAEGLRWNSRIICERKTSSGEFPLEVTLYVHDERFRNLNEKEIADRFCAIAKCQCLISANSVNPYSWIFVQGNGNFRHVYLDADKFDNDEYTIDRTMVKSTGRCCL